MIFFSVTIWPIYQKVCSLPCLIHLCRSLIVIIYVLKVMLFVPVPGICVWYFSGRSSFFRLLISPFFVMVRSWFLSIVVIGSIIVNIRTSCVVIVVLRCTCFVFANVRIFILIICMWLPVNGVTYIVIICLLRFSGELPSSWSCYYIPLQGYGSNRVKFGYSAFSKGKRSVECF